MQPNWLVEGSADVFARTFVSKSYGIAIPEMEAFNDAQGSSLRLAETSDPSKYLSGEEYYQVSEFASWILSQKHGFEAIIQYWKNIGMGLSPEASFEKEFGSSLEKFQSDFEAIRFDFNKVTTYLQGSDDPLYQD